VSQIKPGQHVVPHLFLTCGHCPQCRNRRDSLCSNVSGILGVTFSGGFAEYFVAPAQNFMVLPDSVPFASGGLVSCALVTAVHAIKRSRLKAGESVAIIGMGGIGQILHQILKSRGVHVAAVDRSPQSLDAARRLWRVPCVFECVGTAATMKIAAELAASGGRIVVIGEEPEFPQIDTIQIAQRELEIIGSRNGSKEDAAEAIALLAEGTINPPIARQFALSEINEAFAFMRSGRANGRVIVVINE